MTTYPQYPEPVPRNKTQFSISRLYDNDNPLVPPYSSVTMYYKLYNMKGTELESTSAKKPFVFAHGTRAAIACFEFAIP